MTARRIRTTVRDLIRAHDLLRPGPLVVAVSGGTDSTALLLLLADLREELGLVLHVAHFDHRTRPRAAAADAAFVADLAARVGATIRVGRAEGAAKSEDAARRERYAFLRRAAEHVGATAIATGHTRDDQAETVLLHLVRGSGVDGLAAMRPLRDGIVRPLLCIGRAETAEVCREAGVAPREDPTNRSLRFARNRIRRRVMPELAQINEQVAAALARVADAAASASDALAAYADDALSRATVDDGHIDLARLPPDRASRSLVLSLAWQRSTGRVLEQRHREALTRESLRTDGSAGLDLPGGRARREYGRLDIDPARAYTDADSAAAADRAARAPAPLRAKTPVTWQGWTFVVVKDGDAPDGAYAADVPAVSGALQVRARRPGDRVGGASGRKLQDVLVDAKVPASLRARWPLIAGQDGMVWWVPGVAVPDVHGQPAVRIAATPPPTGEMAVWLRGRRVASEQDHLAKKGTRKRISTTGSSRTGS